MTELGPLDTGFMEMEDTDRHVSLGIGAVAIIEGAPPTREEFRVGVDRGRQRHVRLRQRVRRAPFDITAPVWEDDPNFDLAHHIRWTALPEPHDETALRELIATELTERLDRDHPLWEVVVVDLAAVRARGLDLADRDTIAATWDRRSGDQRPWAQAQAEAARPGRARDLAVYPDRDASADHDRDPELYRSVDVRYHR